MNLKGRHGRYLILTAVIIVLLIGLAAVTVISEKTSPGGDTPQSTSTLGNGDPRSGKAALERYGCAACHIIPGLNSSRAGVGPALQGIAAKQVIGASNLKNTEENLARWIMNPIAMDPKTTMPNMGVTLGDAADIAAYLYQQN